MSGAGGAGNVGDILHLAGQPRTGQDAGQKIDDQRQAGPLRSSDRSKAALQRGMYDGSMAEWTADPARAVENKSGT